MYPDNKIDWPDLANYYNKMRKTNLTIDMIFFKLYWQEEKNTEAIADIFGVCQTAVYHAMLHYRVPHRPRGRNNRKHDRQFLAIPVLEMQEMTRHDIAERLDWSLPTVDSRLQKYHRTFLVRHYKKRRYKTHSA